MNKILRIAQEIKKELSVILQRKEQNFGITTISRIEISKNFYYVKIYVTFLNVNLLNKNEDKKLVKKGIQVLQKKSGYIGRRITKKMNLRFVPEINFTYDTSLINGNRIYSILKNIVKNKKCVSK